MRLPQKENSRDSGLIGKLLLALMISALAGHLVGKAVQQTKVEVALESFLSSYQESGQSQSPHFTAELLHTALATTGATRLAICEGANRIASVPRWLPSSEEFCGRTSGGSWSDSFNAIFIQSELPHFDPELTIRAQVKSSWLDPLSILSSAILWFCMAGILFWRESVLSAFLERLTQMRVDAQIGKVATQVAHDIRSPLTVLRLLAQDSFGMDRKKHALVVNSVRRIASIADELVSMKLNPSTTLEPPHEAPPEGEENSAMHSMAKQPLACLIDEIVHEKSIQLRFRPAVTIDFRITSEMTSLATRIDAQIFKRILSNLMNNALDAVGSSGQICLALRASKKNVFLEISDNGPGIPSGVLSEIGRDGASFGKPGGLGIGLSHARDSLRAFGADLEIHSTAGEGTRVLMKFVRTDAPEWLTKELRIPEQARIAIYDEDFMVHALLEERFQDFAGHSGLQISHFNTLGEFKNWLAEGRAFQESTVIFSSEDGLQDVLENGLGQCCTVISNDYENEALTEKCILGELSILPKALTSSIPIVLEKGQEEAAAPSTHLS